MKVFVPILALSAIVISSCQEKLPITLGNNKVVIISSTTNTASVESPQQKNVLIEYATGVKCPNCPKATKILKQAKDANPDKVIIVALHGGGLTSPIAGESKYDFRTTYAVDLFNTYFAGEPNKPAAVFDRTKQDGIYFVESTNKWLNVINQRLAVSSPLNLYLSSVLNENTGEYTITVKGAYTGKVEKKQSITIMITEDKIIDAQEDGISLIKDYEHNHVLRDMLTNIAGNPLLNEINTVEQGRIFEQKMLYKIPDGKDWNFANLNIIAFVHSSDPDDKEILQVVQAKLTP